MRRRPKTPPDVRGGFFLALIFCSLTLAAFPAAAERVPTVGISVQDYPDDVQPTASEFDVRMRYALAPGGAVSLCEVTRPSRQPGLDTASCRILRERARFRVAAGVSGGEIRFHWLGEASRGNGIERNAPLLIGLPRRMTTEELRTAVAEDHRRGHARIEVDVSEDGVPLACTVAPGGDAPALGRWMCARMVGEGMFIPASDGAAGRSRGVFLLRVGWD
jgi:hypothetical protein